MNTSESANQRFKERLDELARISEMLREYAIELVEEPCVALCCLRNAGALIEEELPGGPLRKKRGDPDPELRSEWMPAVHRVAMREPEGG